MHLRLRHNKTYINALFTTSAALDGSSGSRSGWFLPRFGWVGNGAVVDGVLFVVCVRTRHHMMKPLAVACFRVCSRSVSLCRAAGGVVPVSTKSDEKYVYVYIGRTSTHAGESAHERKHALFMCMRMCVLDTIHILLYLRGERVRERETERKSCVAEPFMYNICLASFFCASPPVVLRADCECGRLLLLLLLWRIC